MILSITPSSSATTSVSLEVKSTLFQLGALIVHLILLFIGFSTQEGTRSTHLASPSPAHRLLMLLFCWRFIEIASIFWTIIISRDPVYRSMFLVV